MGAFSIWHILLVLVVVLLVFGAGKLPRVMGDFAKGIKSFKQGMKEPFESEKAETPTGRVADARTPESDPAKPTTNEKA
ncbi:MAG: twin-arginine translocase TatA/TatE family subunit [Alphaproteobacteria bacterium]